jgi:hypothetical protein
MALGHIIPGYGPLGDRPSASQMPGGLYHATDTGVVYASDGSAWTPIPGYVPSPPQSVSASATITSGRVKFTGSTAGQTLTLTAGVAGTDRFIRNASSVAVTIACTGADTIEGAATFVLLPGEAISLTFVGTDWTVF